MALKDRREMRKEQFPLGKDLGSVLLLTFCVCVKREMSLSNTYIESLVWMVDEVVGRKILENQKEGGLEK